MAGPPLKFNQLLDSFAGPRLKQDISVALYASAEDIRATARRSITSGSVGGAKHVASSPGEAPNNDTGFLAASNEYKSQEDALVPKRVKAWNHVQLAFTAPYAVDLEFGTSKMAARPFLGPAARISRSRMQKRLTAAIKQAATRAARGVK